MFTYGYKNTQPVRIEQMTLLDVDLEFPNLVDATKLQRIPKIAKYFYEKFHSKINLSTIVYIHNNYTLQI